VYKYNDDIYSESDFKEIHALLFTKVDEVIKDRQIIPSKLTEKINTTYNDIINQRLLDDKRLSDSETLADQYMVIEKDVFYAYAINSHRSQGSTYDYVIVDEHDYKMIHNRFNFKYNMMENRNKEKNQLRYVAYSRAKKELYVINE
jgi:hypothetical protein